MMQNISLLGESPVPFVQEDRHARRRERTRAALLEAARTVMSQDGVYTVTIADITRAADVGVGTFYLHFRDKDDVLHAVLDAGLARLDDEIVAEVGRAPQPGNLGLAIRVICERLHANRDLFRIAYSTGNFIEFALAARMRSASFLTGALDKAHAAGLPVRAGDSALLAGLITGMIDHAALLWLDAPEPAPHVVADRIVQLLREGLPAALLV